MWAKKVRSMKGNKVWEGRCRSGRVFTGSTHRNGVSALQLMVNEGDLTGMVKKQGKLVAQISLHCLMHWFIVKEVPFP